MGTQNKGRERQEWPAFTDFVPEIMDRLEQVTDNYPDIGDFNVHKAFTFFIAETFETTEEELFRFTDGPGDAGIDFFIQAPPSYAIYQCKCPTVETLESSETAPTFDRSVVEEVVSAARFLRDSEGIYDSVASAVRRLRTDFQRDATRDSEVTCEVSLAILGELTPSAEEAFNAARRELQEAGMFLNLITWRGIYDKLRALETPADIDFQIDLCFDDPEKELLRHRDYCYILARGTDLYDAWRQHGWALFDWNVRLQLQRSAINRRIVDSLRRAPSRKIFHHLNNGILITCRSYTIDITRGRIRLKGPQIINGCQTVCAIRDAFESLSPREQEEFKEQVRVQVKVIQNADPDFIAELVIATNDQNPMNPRNLKSNTHEQKDLQKRFHALPERWFYERKDGEWESLRTARHRSSEPHQRDYEYTSQSKRSRRFRRIDNQKLAKDWYTWIGYSDQALRGGISYFEQEDIYTRVFRSQPTEQFWQDFAEELYFSPTDDHFISGTPSTHQYLLATAAAEYVNMRRVSWRNNRRDALQRGLERGELEGDIESGQVWSPDQDIDEYLASDEEYRLNIILNNMREILVELVSFSLARRYGPLDTAQSQRLLQVPEIRDFCFSAFSLDFAPPESQDGSCILGPIYAFLQYCIEQYQYAFRAEIQAAPRLKTYFFHRRTVNKIREWITQKDREIMGFDRPWKASGRTFTESLPIL